MTGRRRTVPDVPRQVVAAPSVADYLGRAADDHASLISGVDDDPPAPDAAASAAPLPHEASGEPAKQASERKRAK